MWIRNGLILKKISSCFFNHIETQFNLTFCSVFTLLIFFPIFLTWCIYYRIKKIVCVPWRALFWMPWYYVFMSFRYINFLCLLECFCLLYTHSCHTLTHTHTYHKYIKGISFLLYIFRLNFLQLKYMTPSEQPKNINRKRNFWWWYIFYE